MTLATVSLFCMPVAVKFAELGPAVSAVPYVLPGPVAVTVNAAGFTVSAPLL